MLHTIQDLARIAAPVGFIVGSFLRHQARAIAHVSALGVLGAGLNAGGFLLLLPVLNALAGGEENLMLGSWTLAADHRGLSAMLMASVLCVAAGLFLRHRILKGSLQVLRSTTEEAAVRGVIRISELPGDINIRRAVSAMIGRIAFSCGFVMRQFSLGVTDLLQLGIFVIALVWLSPLITIGLLLPALFLLFLYARSVVLASQANEAKGEAGQALREEVREVTSLLRSENMSEAALREHLDALHRDGAHGESLDVKLDFRREMQRGPMLIEALFPLALVPLALVALATDEWQQHAGMVVVYILLLRTVIGLSQKLAGLFIIVGRFHTDISCYMELCTLREPCSCMFLKADEEMEDTIS